MTPIFAQFTPIPVNPGTVQLLSYVTNALNALVAPTAGIFGEAIPLLNKLGLFALVIGALKWTYDYLVGDHIFSGESYWKVLIRFLICYNLLRYYNAPLPLIGYNFHQIFTEEGRWMAAQINISTLDLFLTKVHQIWGGMEKPHVYDIGATILYFGVALDMIIIELALFAITALSFWAIFHRQLLVSRDATLLLGVGELHDQVLALPRGGRVHCGALLKCLAEFHRQLHSWELLAWAVLRDLHHPHGDLLCRRDRVSKSGFLCERLNDGLSLRR
jgi:hypothetical protein